MDSSLIVKDSAQFDKDVRVKKLFTVEEKSFFFDDVLMKKRLIVDDRGIFKENVVVNQNIRVDGNARVFGNQKNDGRLIVDSLSRFKDKVVMEGDVIRHVYYYTQNPDIYFYRGGGASGPANDWYWSNNHPPQGCYSYYGDKSYAIPEGDFTIEWEVRRPSGTTIGIDTFTVTENDTTAYLIEY